MTNKTLNVSLRELGDKMAWEMPFSLDDIQSILFESTT